MSVTASIVARETSKHYVIVVSYHVSGKRKQKWITTDIPIEGNNKRKVEQKRLELIRAYKAKEVSNGSDILFSDYLSECLNDTRFQIRESTLVEYRRMLERTIKPYFAERKIKLIDLTPGDIQAFYNWRMQEGVSGNTVKRYHALIHKALRIAVNLDRIPNNPSDRVTLPKKEKHIANFYSPDEVRELLQKTEGTNLEIPVLLGVYLGLRRGEIAGLKWQYVDFANHTLSVLGVISDRGTGTRMQNLRYVPMAKTDTSLRSFPMPAYLAERLRKCKEEQDARKRRNRSYNHKWDAFVCVRENGDLLTPEYISCTFNVFLKKTGMRKITFHELRHTNISILVNSGVEMKTLQAWAGHSSYSVTADIYAHLLTGSKERAAEAIEGILQTPTER